MARIAIADRTGEYDGRSMQTRPLGGTETSVIYLAEALARRGHDVMCLTRCRESIVHQGVEWVSLEAGTRGACDLLLAVQHPDLLGCIRRVRRRAVWVMWPPYNVGRRWNAVRMWRYRPLPVFVSDYQLGVYPRWLPRPARRPVLPHGLPDAVRGRAPLDQPPPPHAIFASNPVRNLSWLINLWSERILPHVPGAELHIYGIRDYAHCYARNWAETHERFGRFLPENVPPSALRSLKPHAPARQEALWDAMRASRVMLYGGHRAEAFCLAVAEAQALGVPAVVRPIAVMAERVRHGTTGFVASSDEIFAEHAVSLLTNDHLWRRQHEAALSLQQGSSWDETAFAFEARVIEPLLEGVWRKRAGKNSSPQRSRRTQSWFG
jgi:glycosyltransferase involved in cell wall biosynthesis